MLLTLLDPSTQIRKGPTLVQRRAARNIKQDTIHLDGHRRCRSGYFWVIGRSVRDPKVTSPHQHQSTHCYDQWRCSLTRASCIFPPIMYVPMLQQAGSIAYLGTSAVHPDRPRQFLTHTLYLPPELRPFVHVLVRTRSGLSLTCACNMSPCGGSSTSYISGHCNIAGDRS